jgi:hypothetical protein
LKSAENQSQILLDFILILRNRKYGVFGKERALDYMAEIWIFGRKESQIFRKQKEPQIVEAELIIFGQKEIRVNGEKRGRRRAYFVLQ